VTDLGDTSSEEVGQQVCFKTKRLVFVCLGGKTEHQERSGAIRREA
jgi:hypothetical protein